MRRGNRKALKALVLSFAAMAILAGNANAAQVTDGGSIVAQQKEASYLSVGATAEQTLAFQSTREGGPVFMNGLPDGYVGSETAQGGVTPTNLARAYVPQVQVQGVSNPDGYQPQLRGAEELVIRDTPDGFQPQTKGTDVVSISADSSRFEVGDLALGFGLGLILATAGAIALAMSRGRERAAHT
jgi:hypothetical protein